MSARIESIDGPGGLPLLRLSTGDALAELCPERGALMTRLRIAGDELLYLDESTFVDRTKNVRGGIPILFPIAGSLPNDTYEADDGRPRTLPQHGFARTRPFEVVASETGDFGARVTCRLSDDADSLAAYPWRFELGVTFTLQPNRLLVDTTIVNRDTRSLPHALGFHPYFRVDLARKGDVYVQTDATEAFDNVKKAETAFVNPDFGTGEIDLLLRDHALPGTLLSRPPMRPVRLEWDDAFTTLVLWTLPERPFVCVEPWTAPAGALATSEPRTLDAGASETLRWIISV